MELEETKNPSKIDAYKPLTLRGIIDDCFANKNRHSDPGPLDKLFRMNSTVEFDHFELDTSLTSDEFYIKMNSLYSCDLEWCDFDDAEISLSQPKGLAAIDPNSQPS